MKKLFSLIIVLFFVFYGVILAQDETPSGAIEEKVQERIDLAKSRVTAVLGTVTDIAENTLQIKTGDGNITLVSISGKTTFAKEVKEKEVIDLEDVAIGDFVIAMGTTNGNKVLEAQRVVVASPLAEIERIAVLGKVSDIAGKKVTLSAKDSVQWTLSFPSRWKGPEIADLEEKMEVIAVGIQDEETLTVRSLFLTESKASPSPTPEEN